jgi:hypothetical protein
VIAGGPLTPALPPHLGGKGDCLPKGSAPPLSPEIGGKGPGDRGPASQASPRIARTAAFLGLCLLLGAAGLSCPAKDLSLEVTDTGMAVLAVACRNFDKACGLITDRLACRADLTCRWDPNARACRLVDNCDGAGGSSEAPSKLRAVQVLLVGQNPGKIRAMSRCVPLLPSLDPACAESLEILDKQRITCAAGAMNRAIGNAMRAGLTYDGFEDPSDAFPVLAVYNLSELPSACAEGLDKVGCAKADLACPVEDLLGCAGLAVPINSEKYDVTCASCQGGPRFSVGYDTGPCPPVDGQCFFNGCAKAIGEAKRGGG